jgi:hypothetical protein
VQPDPDEYLDGVNIYIYTGNRPTMFLDPSGKATFAECMIAIGDAFSSDLGRKIIRFMKQYSKVFPENCEVPRAICMCSMTIPGGGHIPPIGTVVADYDPDLGIIIFYMRFRNKASMTQVVLHELVHAYMRCCGVDPKPEDPIEKQCQALADSEVMAYCMSGQCRLRGANRWRGETFKDCVKRAAKSSVENNKQCKPGDEYVRRAWKKYKQRCKNYE